MIDLSVAVKGQLVQLAGRLPVHVRSDVLKRVVHDLGKLARENRNRIVFAIAGWVLSEILNNVFTVPIPLTRIALHLTRGHLSELGLVAGSVCGFFVIVCHRTKYWLCHGGTMRGMLCGVMVATYEELVAKNACLRARVPRLSRSWRTPTAEWKRCPQPSTAGMQPSTA